MRLGESARVAQNRKAARATREGPPKRPDVVAEDGTEYEVVWFPHRDALELLPQNYPSASRHPLDTLELSRRLRLNFQPGGDR